MIRTNILRCFLSSSKLLHMLHDQKLSTLAEANEVKFNRNNNSFEGKSKRTKSRKNASTLKIEYESPIVPKLPRKKIHEASTVAGIAIGITHVSWVTISLPQMEVLEWCAKLLPSDFLNCKNEARIMKVAYDMKHFLPESDLYVMETFSMTGRDLLARINHLHLSCMLAVLLNGFSADTSIDGKVVFQKKHVLNRLFNLVVGKERMSTRGIFQDNAFKNFKPEKNEDDKSLQEDIFSLVKIPPKLLHLYMGSSIEKQEDLSLAFLLAISFIDINIFETSESLEKIQKRFWTLKY